MSFIQKTANSSEVTTNSKYLIVPVTLFVNIKLLFPKRSTILKRSGNIFFAPEKKISFSFTKENHGEYYMRNKDIVQACAYYK